MGITEISGSAAAANGNAGIVPPWLQAGRVTPGSPVATAPSVTDAPPSDARAIATSPAIAGAQSGAAALGVTLVRLVPSRRDTGAREGVARQQAEVEAGVEQVRDFFTGLGVTAREGTDDSLRVAFDPRFPNAAYIPDLDAIQIGVDPRSGRSFGDAKDVVAHEYSHRVIDRMTGLGVGGEDSAIHESLADTFAAAFDVDDWTLGEDIGEPIRDMENPGRLGDPSHVDQFDPRERDMHSVAGIPNKAASIIGNELGRDTMAEIYVDAMRRFIRPGQEIEGLAAATMRSARDLFGPSSPEFTTTVKAWDQVGVLDLLRRDGRG